MNKVVIETGAQRITRFKVEQEGCNLQDDLISIEEPLQIQLEIDHQLTPLMLTMRTPGHDRWLIFGILFSEGVIQSSEDVLNLSPLLVDNKPELNIQRVLLRSGLSVDFERNQRQSASYAGCGLCGKTHLQALELNQSRAMRQVDWQVNLQSVAKLKALLAQQPLFSETGGVHAAGLVEVEQGQLVFERAVFFEDVGRHNALDKLIGYQLCQHNLSRAGVLVLSGRVGFELVQKAIRAGFSVIVALGAPSSLAIQAAKQFGVMLIGFAKEQSFNLYTPDAERIER